MLAEQQAQLSMAQDMHQDLQVKADKIRVENERKDFEYAERLADVESMLEKRTRQHEKQIKQLKRNLE